MPSGLLTSILRKLRFLVWVVKALVGASLVLGNETRDGLKDEEVDDSVDNGDLDVFLKEVKDRADGGETDMFRRTEATAIRFNELEIIVDACVYTVDFVGLVCVFFENR